jgi:hypothetical protein
MLIFIISRIYINFLNLKNWIYNLYIKQYFRLLPSNKQHISLYEKNNENILVIKKNKNKILQTYIKNSTLPESYNANLYVNVTSFSNKYGKHETFILNDIYQQFSLLNEDKLKELFKQIYIKYYNDIPDRIVLIIYPKKHKKNINLFDDITVITFDY